MADTFWTVTYAGETYRTATDPGLDAVLQAGTATLTVTTTDDVEHIFSVTPGVPIVVSKHVPGGKDRRATILN